MPDSDDREFMPPAVPEGPKVEVSRGLEPGGFYGLLQAIRERPGMYLGRRSLAALESWLYGYIRGRYEGPALTADEEEFFEEFDAFVCKSYRWRDVGGWQAKIAYYYKDEDQALEEFFRLLDEFRAAQRRAKRRKS